MSLFFPYRPEVVMHPIPPPTLPPNNPVRWRSLVTVHVTGSLRRQPVDDVLIDTGAVDVVFKLDLAKFIGVKFESWAGSLKWRGTNYQLKYGRVGLELADDTTKLRWEEMVGFSNAPLSYYGGVLGQCGFLQYMNATFNGEDRELALDPNPSFPGKVLTV